MYILANGNTVTADQIKAAYNEGKAVLVYGRANQHTSAGLMLDGSHYDTRGTCHSMWDEAWTKVPKTLQDALQCATTPGIAGNG